MTISIIANNNFNYQQHYFFSRTCFSVENNGICVYNFFIYFRNNVTFNVEILTYQANVFQGSLQLGGFPLPLGYSPAVIFACWGICNILWASYFLLSLS